MHLLCGLRNLQPKRFMNVNGRCEYVTGNSLSGERSMIPGKGAVRSPAPYIKEECDV